MGEVSNQGLQGGEFDLTQFYAVFFEEAGENLANMESLLIDIDIDAPSDETTESEQRREIEHVGPEHDTHTTVVLAARQRRQLPRIVRALREGRHSPARQQDFPAGGGGRGRGESGAGGGGADRRL